MMGNWNAQGGGLEEVVQTADSQGWEGCEITQ